MKEKQLYETPETELVMVNVEDGFLDAIKSGYKGSGEEEEW